MPFIGIVANENDSNFIKNELLKKYKENKFEIININNKSLENLKNVRFETIIVKENINKILKISNYINNILENASFLVVNTDIKENEEKLNNYKCFISYGFNTNAIITISSIKEENIMICLQKQIQGINNQITEQQECNINIGKHNIEKLYNYLAIFATKIIYGLK